MTSTSLAFKAPLRGLARRLAVSAVTTLMALAATPPTLAQTRVSLQGLQDQLTVLQRTTNCLALPTTEVSVDAVSRGAYLPSGAHLADMPIMGQFLVGTSLRGPYRSYFAFDLRRIGPGLLNREDLLVAAELILYNRGLARDGVDGFRSDATDTLTVVLNRAAWMTNDGVAALMAGTAGSAGHVDLADGPDYGHYVASAADNGNQFNIRLSDMAIRDLNRANGGSLDNSGRLLFAIGAALQTPGLSGNAYFLGGGVPRHAGPEAQALRRHRLRDADRHRVPVIMPSRPV